MEGGYLVPQDVTVTVVQEQGCTRACAQWPQGPGRWRAQWANLRPPLCSSHPFTIRAHPPLSISHSEVVNDTLFSRKWLHGLNKSVEGHCELHLQWPPRDVFHRLSSLAEDICMAQQAPRTQRQSVTKAQFSSPLVAEYLSGAHWRGAGDLVTELLLSRSGMK